MNPLYLNRAHNEPLEILLDGGLFGLVLMVLAVIWFVKKSLIAWRGVFKQTSQGARGGEQYFLARAGSSIIFLTAIASLVDYPARTPIVMALVILAAIWLASAEERPSFVR